MTKLLSALNSSTQAITCSTSHIFALQSILSDEQVADSPVLVLGNKIDRPGAISEEELKTFFGLHGQTTGKVSTWSIACFILL